MKTTVDIPEDTLRDVMRFAKAKTKREAILTAIEDFNRRRRVDQFLKDAAGSMVGFPDNDEIEASDVRREESLRKRWGRGADS